MQINRDRTRQLLRDFEFETLWIEELGWDRHREEVRTEIRERGVDEGEYLLIAIAQKRGMVVFQCSARTDEGIPDYAIRRKIQREVAKSVYEHLIIYTDAEQTTQIWQWVKREPGKPLACREHRYHRGQSGEALIQKLETIAFSLEEEDDLTLLDVTGRVRAAFDVERVTRRFYDRFKTEHAQFLNFLEGVPDQEMERWYASVMLNRLMFIYFIQKKDFLNNDTDYLQTKLEESQANGTDRYYTDFLCPLFFEGFAKPESARSREMGWLLGKVPYLNGGIFQRHQIEELHGERIQIPDAAFEGLFDFFDHYQWHLDERPLRNDNEINPDVLGYIFEKYINQKQMGAYYTKEDITEYISKNTVIPFLFDAARKGCRIAFEGEASVWQLLSAAPDRYIYDDVKTGVELDLPEDIEAGIDDASKRTMWNTSAPDEYALPTEIWREVVARRERYKAIYAKLSNGEIDDINALITHNLNIHQFAQDVIENCEDSKLLDALWEAITQVRILDPTCGSGAFLFAALNILKPLYEACLNRMQAFLEELQYAVKKPSTEKFSKFREVLEHIEQHPNCPYFILKSIIINNLYGVDIMEEAIEICKLRLFLKMVAQIEDVRQIEPLPDIDFNIQAGNTLVGYTTYDEVEIAVTENRIDFDNTMENLQEKAEDVEHLFEQFRLQQTELGGAVTPDDKQVLRDKLKVLEDELNLYLAGEYRVDLNRESAYQHWLSSHKPFHWFIEFYRILKDGGFDVIIGNPPYVEYNKVKRTYTVQNSELITGGNLHSMITYRSFTLSHDNSYLSLIVPVALPSTDRMMNIRKTLSNYAGIWISNYAIRPSKLFTGAEQRLSIFIASRRYKRKMFTTKYTKWNSEERNYLFSCLQYQEWSQRKTLRNVWPKFDIPVSEAISYKVVKQAISIAECLGNTTSCSLYYKNTGIGYYIVVTQQPPVCYINGQRSSSSRETTLVLTNQNVLSVVHCVLNSSLFFLVYQQLSNCRDFNPADIHTFRLPRSLLSEPALQNLSEQLQQSIEANSWFQTRHQRQTGEVRIQSFTPSLSKFIIDEIDCVLAQHYGFTDEELDFIINYDIKYRMGLGSG